MRIYEELFIVRPDATDEEVDPVVEQVRTILTNEGGTLDKIDKWGVRRMAYRVMKYDEAQYILLQFTAKPETVREIERRLRVSDQVMKFITVRIDEKLKRIEKRKKAREKRAARKPVMPVSAPAVASPLMPGEGHGPVPGAPTPGAPTPSAPAPAAPAPASTAPPSANTPAAAPEQA